MLRCRTMYAKKSVIPRYIVVTNYSVNSNSLYVSTDNLATGVYRAVGAQPFSSIALCNSNPRHQAGVVDGGYIYTTDNAWETWTVRMAPGSRAWKYVGIHADNPLRQTAIVGGDTDVSPFIYTTDDGWVTYSGRLVGLYGTGVSGAMCACDPLVQMAIAGGNMFHTTNRWASYRSFYLNVSDVFAVGAISASDPLVQTVIGQSADDSSIYLLFSTIDGWKNFIAKEFSFPLTSIAISPSDPLEQYLTGGTQYGFTRGLFRTLNRWTGYGSVLQNTISGKTDRITISPSDPRVQVCSQEDYQYLTTDKWMSCVRYRVGSYYNIVAMN